MTQDFVAGNGLSNRYLTAQIAVATPLCWIRNQRKSFCTQSVGGVKHVFLAKS